MPSAPRPAGDAAAIPTFDGVPLEPRLVPVPKADDLDSALADDPLPDDTASDTANLTGPLYWARAHVPRPPRTKSPTGITLSPFQPAPDIQVGSPELLKNLRLAAPGLVRTANEILDVEGPMPFSRLITLLARRFGIPRLDPQRRHHMTRIVAPQFRLIDDFAWPTGMKPKTWRGARKVGDPADRRITDISREELQNAMEFVLGSTPALPREELVTESLALLGYNRIPTPARMWVDDALDAGVRSRRFSSGETGIRLS